MSDTWTQKDDLLLAEMLDRKQRVLKGRMDPLIKLVCDDMPHIRMHMAGDIAEWLAQNADALRDLLQPFYSDERVAGEG